MPTGLNKSSIANNCINDIIATDFNDLLYYGENEYTIYIPNNKHFYLPDLYNANTHKIIEFFGDYWHCNPLKYKNTDINKTSKRLAQEIWNYDNEKINTLKQLGYDVMIIWEYDYVHDTDNVIDKARKFLFNK